jgi:hypothetical protein
MPEPSSKKRTDRKKGPLFGRFGRKTGGPRLKKTFYFGFFLFFGELVPCKPLIFRNFHILDPSKKNRAKKPTVGFCLLEDMAKSSREH